MPPDRKKLASNRKAIYKNSSDNYRNVADGRNYERLQREKNTNEQLSNFENIPDSKSLTERVTDLEHEYTNEKFYNKSILFSSRTRQPKSKHQSVKFNEKVVVIGGDVDSVLSGNFSCYEVPLGSSIWRSEDLSPDLINLLEIDEERFRRTRQSEWTKKSWNFLSNTTLAALRFASISSRSLRRMLSGEYDMKANMRYLQSTSIEYDHDNNLQSQYDNEVYSDSFDEFQDKSAAHLGMEDVYRSTEDVTGPSIGKKKLLKYYMCRNYTIERTDEEIARFHYLKRAKPPGYLTEEGVFYAATVVYYKL